MNRTSFLLLLPVLFVLTSGLGFGASYDAVYDIYFGYLNGAQAGDCYDLDLLVTWNLSLPLHSDNLSVSCASPDADLKCQGGGIYGGYTYSLNNNKVTPLLADTSHAYGEQWFGSSTQITYTSGFDRNAVVTTEGRYARYESQGINGFGCCCANLNVWLKNATDVPYWEHNDSKEIFATTYTAEANIGGSQYIYFDVLDAGASFSAVNGMDWYFQNTVSGLPNCMRMTDATTDRCHVGWTDSTSNILSDINYWECPIFSSDDYCEINVYPQVYTLMTVNKTDGNINSKYGDSYNYMSVQWIDNAYDNFDFYYMLYQNDYVGLGDIVLAPYPPVADVQLNFTWTTSATADSRLQYRLAPLNNLSDISSWATLINSTYTTSHFMKIDAINMIDNYYYEWRVLSDKNGTTRSSEVYNFSFGVAVAPNVTFSSGSGGEINPQDYYYFDFETGTGVSCVNASCGQSYHDLAVYIPQRKVSDYIGSDGIVYHDSETTTANTLDAVPCEVYDGTYTSRSYFDVNSEVGYYDVFCFDQHTYHGGEEFYGAVKFTAIENESLAFYYVLYSTYHFGVSNVEYQNPAYANEIQTISWETARRSDSNLTYRSRSTNSTAWGNWSSVYDDRQMYDHDLSISADQIQLGYVYEFYVTSTTEDNVTDSSAHYYFDVVTAPYPEGEVGDALEILAGIIGVPLSSLMVLVAMCISIGVAVLSAMKGKSGILGIVVFVSMVVVFTVFGWIPFWIAIILGVISAFIVAKFGSEIFGGSG